MNILSKSMEHKSHSSGDLESTSTATSSDSSTAHTALYAAPCIHNSILARYVYLERYAGEGTQTYSATSQYSEFPLEFQPKSENPYFSLPVVRVPKEMVEITLGSPRKELSDIFIQDETVSLCAHPIIFGNKAVPHMEELMTMPTIAPFCTTPTSSSRSVVVLDKEDYPFVVKCHCPVKVSRFHRNLGPATIRHSVTVSHILDHTSITHLPETIGISLPSTTTERGWGFIVREMIARPSLSTTTPVKTMLIPCFALYGRDLHHPEELPLIVKMIHNSTEDPKSYVLNHVMLPIIEDFVRAFKSEGILLEAHGQNSLLEVDEELNPIRIIHRDMDDTVDANIRRSLGLSMDGLSKGQIIEDPTEQEPLGSVHSLIYDSSIGHHHFSYLAQVMHEYFGVAEEELQQACKEKFLELFPDHERYFPREIYYYGKGEISHNEF
ncbi:MAG: hypothetical protein HY860_05675, partial [Chlamydiales bacterium]|nr:hypothetical protein [Chlamydiales bacterium]